MSIWYPKYCCHKPWQDCPNKTKCDACRGECEHYVVVGCGQCQTASTNIEPYYCSLTDCLNASQTLCDPCEQDPTLPECEPICIGGCSYFEDTYQPTNMECHMRDMFLEGITSAQIGKPFWDAPTHHDESIMQPNGNPIINETGFRNNYPTGLPSWYNVPRTGRSLAYCSYDGLECRDDDAGKWGEYYFEKQKLAPNNWYPTTWDAQTVKDYITDVAPFSRNDFNRRWHIWATLTALNDRDRIGLQIRVAHNGMSWRANYDSDGNLESDGNRTGIYRNTKIIYLESMDGGMADPSVYRPAHNYVEKIGNRVEFKFQLYDWRNNAFAEDDHYFEGHIT